MTAAEVNAPENLPRAPDSERAVIGGILCHPDCISDVAMTLREEHFYAYANRLIYRAALELFERGVRPETVAVADVLIGKKQLHEVGPAYLAELGATYASFNVSYYADIVREKALMRSLLYASQEISVLAVSTSEPADQIIAEAEQKLFAVGDLCSTGENVSIAQAMSEAGKWIDRRTAATTDDGVLSGLIDLDAKTGGFHDGELTFVGARPSVGKSALALHVVRRAAQNGVPSLLVSLEMSRVELSVRLACTEAGVDSQAVRKGILSGGDADKLTCTMSGLSRLPIIVDDTPNQTMLRIAANARRLKRRQGIRFIVVDYLQLIDAENRREAREQQVASISRRCKLLARELKVPVMVLAQLNRDVEHRSVQRPTLADLRESGSQEQDADTVLLLWRPEGTDSNIVQVEVAKQRNGPIGDVRLVFNRQFTRFENYAPGF